MSNYIILVDEQGSPFLAHYGIKGQKWGIRRYQNPDGSLTAEGIRRYGKSGAEYLDAKRERKSAEREYSKKFNKFYNRSYQEWSPIKSHREASHKRWEEAVDAADKYNSANDRYKAAKKQMKRETSYKAKLQQQNYKKYSRDNLPLVSIGKHYSMNSKYWKNAIADIRSLDTGRGKAFINAYLDQPLHVSGITGTSDTTLRKRLKGQFIEWY